MRKRREEFGFSYIVVHEAEMDALAPVHRRTCRHLSEPARIGILGGTFDPPHLGHVAAARAVIERLGLDRLLLVVANDPWQKSGQRAVSPPRTATP